MNGVDKDHRPEFCGPLGVLLALILFPGTVILVLAFFPVHNLTLVVYVLVVVGGCVL